MAIDSNVGLFIPTTDVYDVSALQEIDVNSQEFKYFLVRLRQSINNAALAINLKDSGYYVPTEFINGQVYFPNPGLSSTTAQSPTYRQVFRKVIDFGALPDTASKSVAHGIITTAAYSFTRIYATASDTTAQSYIPIPYASTTGDDIELSVDATNVTITTLSDRTSFDVCYVVVEYLKQ